MKRNRNPLPTGDSFVKGAAILGMAAVVSKLLGTLQKIPLQNIGGDAVFGIYNAVYQLYGFVLTLMVTGIPIAMSRYISEASVKEEDWQEDRLLRAGFWLSVLISVACTVLFYAGSPLLAAMIGMQQAETALKAVAPAFLFAPLLALYRGYFLGRQTMLQPAVSQVVEQFVRVATMLLLILWLIAGGVGNGGVAAGAAFGSTAGAFAGLLVITVWFWRRRKRIEKSATPLPDRSESTSQVVWKLGRYALHSGVGALAIPLFMLVDALTIPRLLQRSGFTENEAAHAFGLYNHGLPLVQLVAMLAGAVSSAIVPFIAEAHAAGKASAIRTNTELAVRLTWLVGIAATAGLSVLAWPINVMFFRSPDGWETIAILAGTALFSTLTTVMASLLQGLGKAGLPAKHMLWATVVKIGLNLMLVGAYGINGAAWSAVLAFALASVLNGISLRRITGVSFAFGRFLVRPIAAVLLMILVVWLIRGILENPAAGYDRLRETVVVLAAVAGGALFYAGAMLRFGCITAQDIMRLGGKGERLGAMLRRLRLLPRS